MTRDFPVLISKINHAEFGERLRDPDAYLLSAFERAFVEICTKKLLRGDSLEPGDAARLEKLHEQVFDRLLLRRIKAFGREWCYMHPGIAYNPSTDEHREVEDLCPQALERCRKAGMLVLVGENMLALSHSCYKMFSPE